jgi:hypothetical protein
MEITLEGMGEIDCDLGHRGFREVGPAAKARVRPSILRMEGVELALKKRGYPPIAEMKAKDKGR